MGPLDNLLREALMLAMLDNPDQASAISAWAADGKNLTSLSTFAEDAQGHDHSAADGKFVAKGGGGSKSTDKPNGKPAPGAGAHTSNSPPPPTPHEAADHAEEGLAEKLPEEAKQPGTWGKIKQFVAGAAGSIYTGASALGHKLHELAPDILDVAADYAKIFYAGRGTGQGTTPDPFAEHLGFGANTVAVVASHVLGRASNWLKSKIGVGFTESRVDVGEAASVLAGMFAQMHSDLDLPTAGPTEEELAEYLEENLGKKDPAAFAEVRAPAPAKSGDVALAGPDGKRIAKLLKDCEKIGVEALGDETRSALERLIPSRRILAVPQLWDADERRRLEEALAGTLAAAELLGRARIIEMAEAGDVATFAESWQPKPWSALGDEPVVPLPPLSALEYFRSLIPSLGIEPLSFGREMRRRAFTMVVAAETTLLDRVRKLIADRLATGEDFGSAAGDISRLMDDAGVSSNNPQYSEQVWRTNAMDAYNTGAMDKFQSNPLVLEAFPVWKYLGIKDGRAGSDHLPKFGKYYPNTAVFAAVRGKRIFNCRCTFAPIYRVEWERLQKAGARVETTW